MRVTMLLADHAAVADNKLYINGGGWSVASPIPSPTAIAIKIDVPWDQANIQRKFDLELVDEDGQVVMVPTPIGDQPLRISGNFEPGRPPGLKHGVNLDVNLAINVGPLPLQPDRRYAWRLLIDGETEEHWQVSFTTRAGPPQPQSPIA
jgi:hypothetical protein